MANSKKPSRKVASRVDADALTRQSESPDLDITASGNATLSDVNQLNAFGGDRPARSESVIESHGEGLEANQVDNASVEAAGEERPAEDESRYSR